MSTKALLEDLRRKDVRLEADGLILRVDAPDRADVAELGTTLRKHKRALIRLLERERRRLEQAASRGLVIKWSSEPGWISLHDPTTGEWHEIKASECLPTVVDTARAHRRRKKSRGV